MSAALQIYSPHFDADFFKLPAAIRARIQSAIDRLGQQLDTYSHHRMKGVDAFRIRVGDYRIIYRSDRSRGVLYLLPVGHPLFCHRANQKLGKIRGCALRVTTKRARTRLIDLSSVAEYIESEMRAQNNGRRN